MIPKISNDLRNLQKQILECKFCKKQFGFKPNPIIWGHKLSKIVHISQAPSKSVHETSKPFNDLSGKKLREWYQVSDEVFYNQDNFYITAVAHCFPGKGTKHGDKNAPIVCAKKWLLKELSLINNKFYLVVGRQAANFLFPKKDYKKLIFSDQNLNGKLAYVLPHPSPLNIRWLKDNPNFLMDRLPVMRETIQQIVFS